MREAMVMATAMATAMGVVEAKRGRRKGSSERYQHYYLLLLSTLSPSSALSLSFPLSVFLLFRWSQSPSHCVSG